MAIKAEHIQQSEALKDLAPEKVEAIVKLSENLFKEEIDTYAGTTKRRWEEDIKGLYGGDKPDPKMPAHEFLKTAWQERENKFKDELEKAKANPIGTDEIKSKYEAEIERLKGEMKTATLHGSELLRKDIEEYKQRLRDMEEQKTSLQKDIQNERKTWEQKYLQAEKEKMLLEIGYEKSTSLIGVELDPKIPESAQQTIIDARWHGVLSKYSPERVKLENGQTITQWRDKDGNIARNPNNNREPYTTKELILEELRDVLKTSRQQQGGGTSGGSGGGATIQADLSAARSQVEFDDLTRQVLLAQGLRIGTAEFAKKQAELIAENKDFRTKLPLR